jgi:exopolysaccharide biosynthesis WecB/TagA/CpsF family protein
VKVFFYGSDETTLAALCAKLRERWPTLIIAGTRPSRFRRATEAEWQDDATAIRSSGADVVFCGLGCPRQEIWVREMRDHQIIPLVAVGAAFAFHAGRLAMAPTWMQNSGLEWAYRLSREPFRLWRRYLYLNPLYVSGVVLQKLGLKKYDVLASTNSLKLERWS